MQICKVDHSSFAGPARGQHQLRASAEPRDQHPLGRRQVDRIRHNPQYLATKPSSSTGIKQPLRAFKKQIVSYLSGHLYL